MSLNDKMTQLANNLRTRYKKTGKLSLDDMIRLTTPPENPILVSNGAFKLTTDPSNATALTANDGATIAGNCYIVPSFYTTSKSLLDNPTKRPNLTIRLHFTVVSTNSTIISWGFYGAGSLGTWNPSKSDTSDITLPTGLLIDEHNGVLFSSSGTTVIDLTQSYIEIITPE